MTIDILDEEYLFQGEIDLNFKNSPQNLKIIQKWNKDDSSSKFAGLWFGQMARSKLCQRVEEYRSTSFSNAISIVPRSHLSRLGGYLPAGQYHWIISHLKKCG